MKLIKVKADENTFEYKSLVSLLFKDNYDFSVCELCVMCFKELPEKEPFDQSNTCDECWLKNT